MPSILTRGQIISEGLELGGNPGLSDRARVFLNILLNHIERVWDWTYLEKEAPISLSAGDEKASLAAVTDFGKVLQVHMDKDGVPLKQVRYDEIWRKIRVDQGANSQGTPTEFAVEPDKTDLVVWPIPKKAAAGKLRYISVPVQPDPGAANEVTYNADVPNFPDSYALVMAVAEFAKLYDQEEFFALTDQLVARIMAEARVAEWDNSRASAVSAKLDGNIHKTFKDS